MEMLNINQTKPQVRWFPPLTDYVCAENLVINAIMALETAIDRVSEHGDPLNRRPVLEDAIRILEMFHTRDIVDGN